MPNHVLEVAIRADSARLALWLLRCVDALLWLARLFGRDARFDWAGLFESAVYDASEGGEPA